MKNFFDLFKRHPKPNPAPDPAMQALLGMLSMTEEQELSCDDVFALLDQFAELIQRGEDASQLMPMVQKHLNMCPDCREEYETLLQMMRTSSKDENQHS
ncbi:MAG TPA: hypothetical protein VMT91_00670 [Anaerolineales bacterium]|nr:hypothetical protein [Anaerolineales bacterium]